MGARSLIARLRQHHGLEHASMTLLSKRLPKLQVVARSDLDGFVVFGEVGTEALRATVDEALARLKSGQDELALHANCGSNLVAAGVLAGFGALIGSSGRSRSMLDRLPGAVLGATLALLGSARAGRWVQEHLTTSADVDGLRVAAVEELPNLGVRRHRVRIREEPTP